MSARPRYASLAAKALRREDRSDDVSRGEPRTQRIDAIRLAIRQRARKKRLWRMGLGVAFLAAAASAVLAVRGHRGTGESIAEGARGVVYVERNGAREGLVSGAKIRSGDHVVVNDGAAVELALATGTHLALESQGDLSVVSQDRNQVYWLTGGSMRARVAKLQAGQRFVVRTVDAEVEVRGTQFRVATAKPEPSCGAGTTTRVSVTEGIVTVRHAGTETRVAAGEEWPAGCRRGDEEEVGRADALRPQEAPMASSPRGRVASAPPANVADSRGVPGKSSVRATSSELAAQNDLFARATDQKRAGDARGGIAAFDHFLTRYPNSELAESAAVERWRLLAQIDPASGRAAAGDYLIRYPNGFARSDARALLDHHE